MTKEKFMEIPLNKLVTDKLNPRKDLEDINELAESIELNGLQVPIIVEDLKDGRYLISNGHRRHMAYNVLKKKTGKDYMVTCQVENKMSEKDRLLKQTVIDVQTKNWTVPERDAAWKKIWDSGKYSANEFRTMIGTNSRNIDDFLDRLNLDPEIKKLNVNAGILQETKTLDVETRKKVIKYAHKTGIGAMGLRQQVRVLKEASAGLVDAFTKEDINIEQVQKLNNLPKEKQDFGVATIKNINRQIKDIPKLIEKDAVVDKKDPHMQKIIQVHEYFERLQTEIGNASGQMMTIEGVLKQLDVPEFDKVFTLKLKNSTAVLLKELKESIEPASEMIDKLIVKWGK